MVGHVTESDHVELQVNVQKWIFCLSFINVIIKTYCMQKYVKWP